MNEKFKNPIFYTWVLLLGFIFFAILKKNWEFLFYSVSLIILVVLVMVSNKKFNYPKIALWGLNSWLLLHLLGGMAKIGETRLYDFMLINIVGTPFDILKYDQFVHAYCYFVAAFFVFAIIKSFSKPKSSLSTMIFITIIACIGIGGINEIIEFSAVVLLGSEGVGGYYNNALDLVMNTLGALIAIPFLKKMK